MTNQDIIDKLEEAEDYYTKLIEDNQSLEQIGLQKIFLKKIDNLFFTITALRYRVDKEIFDDISETLYYKLIRLLPITIV